MSSAVHRRGRTNPDRCGDMFNTLVIRVRDSWVHKPICYLDAGHGGDHEARDRGVTWGNARQSRGTGK